MDPEAPGQRMVLAKPSDQSFKQRQLFVLIRHVLNTYGSNSPSAFRFVGQRGMNAVPLVELEPAKGSRKKGKKLPKPKSARKGKKKAEESESEGPSDDGDSDSAERKKGKRLPKPKTTKKGKKKAEEEESEGPSDDDESDSAEEIDLAAVGSDSGGSAEAGPSRKPDRGNPSRNARKQVRVIPESGSSSSESEPVASSGLFTKPYRSIFTRRASSSAGSDGEPVIPLPPQSKGKGKAPAVPPSKSAVRTKRKSVIPEKDMARVSLDGRPLLGAGDPFSWVGGDPFSSAGGDRTVSAIRGGQSLYSRPPQGLEGRKASRAT